MCMISAIILYLLDMVHPKVRRVLEIFSKLAKLVGGTLILKGGALRTIWEENVLPNDVDLYISGGDMDKLRTMLFMMRSSGTLELIQDDWFELRYNHLRMDRFKMRLPGWEDSLQVDVMYEEPNSDTVANMLRTQVVDGRMHSLSSVNPIRLLDAIHDAKNHIIRVNPELEKEMKYNAMTRFHIWRRVLKYLQDGWTLDKTDAMNATLPKWLQENQQAKPSCGHVFDAEEYIKHCIQMAPLENRTGEPAKGAKCPTCGTCDET